MSGFTYNINFAFSGVGQLGGIVSQLSVLSSSVNSLNSNVSNLGQGFQNFRNTGGGAIRSVGSELRSLAVQVGGTAAVVKSLGTTANFESMENAIKFAGGKEGAANIAFLKSEIARLGLPMEAAYQGFRTLSGGLYGSTIAAKEQQRIFTSVAQAGTVLGMSADEMKGTFLAVSQMASKGTVSAEELRGQLGERLPGAFSIAARSLGMTTAQLDKALKDGAISATAFLPKFAAELEKTFGSGVQNALNSSRTNFNQFQNALTQLSINFGTTIMPTITDFTTNKLIPLFSVIGSNIGTIFQLGGAALFAYGVYKTWAVTTAISTAAMWAWNTATGAATISQGLLSVATGISTAITGGFTTAVTALNAAFAANPIGILIIGLGALAAGVKYAWDTFSGFRGFLLGMWGVIKELGALVYERLILPFKALGETVIGVLTFDVSMISKGFDSFTKVGQSLASNAGARIANAYNEGYNGAVSPEKNSFTAANAITKANANGLPKPLSGASKPPTDGEKTARNITGGGTKNIVINIGRLGSEQITVHTTNLKEGAGEIQKVFQEMFLQIINKAEMIN